MKKLLFAIAAVATAAVSFALANDDETMVITKNNGKIHAIHTNEIEKVTVSEYELAEKFYDLSVDTVLVHDTINNYVEVHDTIVIVEIEQIHDSIFLTDTLYITEFVHDTIYVASGTENGIHEGHEYVDLGLTDLNGNPIYWATCNLGASSSLEYGLYYLWGDTTGHSIEDNDAYNGDYKWIDSGTSLLTKYCTDSRHGVVDNITSLELEDDAANVLWGGSWRLPTTEEMYQLLVECEWTWDNTRKGYKVSRKGNGAASIFLPATGCRDVNGYDGSGNIGHYWTSSLSDYSYCAHCLFFNPDSHRRYDVGREIGCSIRPVYRP